MDTSSGWVLLESITKPHSERPIQSYMAIDKGSRRFALSLGDVVDYHGHSLRYSGDRTVGLLGNPIPKTPFFQYANNSAPFYHFYPPHPALFEGISTETIELTQHLIEKDGKTRQVPLYIHFMDRPPSSLEKVGHITDNDWPLVSSGTMMWSPQRGLYHRTPYNIASLFNEPMSSDEYRELRDYWKQVGPQIWKEAEESVSRMRRQAALSDPRILLEGLAPLQEKLL